jgi:N-acetylneuraminate synthase
MKRVYLDPASEDLKILRTSRETLKRAVALTAELGKSFGGKPKLVVHPGGITLEKHANPKKLLSIFKESLEEIASDEVEILPENLPPRPWVFGGEWVGNIFQAADEIKGFLKETGHSMCLDTSHLALACNAQGLNLTDEIGKLKDETRHLHISDGAGLGEEGLQIGEGSVDWKAVMQQLAGYKQTMVPEIWQGHLHSGRGFLQAMGHLKHYMK